MDMDMDIDLAPAVAASGRKRPAGAEDAAGLEQDWLREEELRGKVTKWNSREADAREDEAREIRELLHKGYIHILPSAAAHPRHFKKMEELALIAPKAFAHKRSGVSRK